MTFSTPEKNKFLQPLKDNFEAILKEYQTIKGFVRHPWPEIDLHDGKWTAYGFVGPGGQRDAENCSRCPKTIETIDSIDIPYIAAYSILDPGCFIHPHKGYTNDVIRVHLGLEIPTENPVYCGIKVLEETKGWKAGELLILNDRLEHSAWNMTAETRAILLVDFPKDRFNV